MNVNGTVALGGNLVVSFVNSFVASGRNVFTVLSSTGPFGGVFSNIASGSRLNVADDSGSFLVTYDGNTVVLSDFMPIAHPPPQGTTNSGGSPAKRTASTRHVVTSDQARPVARAGRSSAPRARPTRMGIALQSSDDLVNLMADAGTTTNGIVTVHTPTSQRPAGAPKKTPTTHGAPKVSRRVPAPRPAAQHQVD